MTVIEKDTMEAIINMSDAIVDIAKALKAINEQLETQTRILREQQMR